MRLWNIPGTGGTTEAHANIAITNSNITIDALGNGGAFGSADGFSLIGVSNFQLTHSNLTSTTNPSGALITFTSDTSTGISRAGNGFLVDHCNFTPQSTEPTIEAYPVVGTIVLGFQIFAITGLTNNVIIRNSTFSRVLNPAAPLGLDILCFGGEGILIENNIFDSNSPGYLTTTPPCEQQLINGIPVRSANIQLGGAQSSFNVTSATIRGNQIGGGTQYGIYSSTGLLTTPNTSIVIEDNNITAAEAGVLFENTVGSKVTENLIAGVSGSVCNPCGIGIHLAGNLPWNASASSSCNALLNNTVVNNVVGIVIDETAEGNLLKGNKVFNNSKHQIVARKKNNVKLDNTTFKKPKCNPCVPAIVTPAVASVKRNLVQPNLDQFLKEMEQMVLKKTNQVKARKK